MKNVRQFTVTDAEIAALKPETIAAWKMMTRHHTLSNQKED